MKEKIKVLQDENIAFYLGGTLFENTSCRIASTSSGNVPELRL